jgi:hypothetical protein
VTKDIGLQLWQMHRQWGWHQRAAVAQPLLCAQLQLGSIRRRPCVVALLLLCAQLQLWQTAAQGAAPPACTPAIVSRIQWGAGTNSLGVSGTSGDTCQHTNIAGAAVSTPDLRTPE